MNAIEFTNPITENQKEDPTTTLPIECQNLLATIREESQAVIEMQEKSVPRKKVIPLSFSRLLAKDVGINEALILKYLGARVLSSKKKIDHVKWTYLTTTEIANRYPFLGRTTVSNALGRLEKLNLVVVGNYNLLAYDRTKWYHVNDENRDKAERDLVCFDPTEASHYGFKAAIVLNHIRWSMEHHPEVLDDGWLKISPTSWVKHQTFFSKKEVRSALAKLVQDGVLEKKPQPSSGKRAGLYRILAQSGG